jgi:hypothetical protein
MIDQSREALLCGILVCAAMVAALLFGLLADGVADWWRGRRRR